MNMALVKAEAPAAIPATPAKVLPLEPKRQPLASRITPALGDVAARVVPPIVVIALTLLIWELLCREPARHCRRRRGCSTIPGS